MTVTSARLIPRWRDLVEVRPHDRDQWAALRVALATGAPLVVLWAIGREDLDIYAVFGAFASAYGRNLPHLSRARMQSVAGLAQLASLTLGGVVALSPHRYALIVPIAAIWAAMSSLLADTVRWTPPGPLFQIFALAGVAAIPGTPAQLGQGVLAGAGSIAWALVIVGGGHLFWRHSPWRMRNPYALALPAAPAQAGRGGRALMFGTGVLVAGAIPSLIGIGHPYWAMVSAIAALSAPGSYHRVLRATHRFFGTLVGLAVGAAILAFRPSGLVAVILIVALQAAIELFVVRNYSIALLFMTPLVLMMGELSGHQPLGELIWERGVETTIGVAVAIVIVLVMTRPFTRAKNASQ